jgi:CheY-like chemotaxis protein
MKILIVEDETKTAEYLHRGLSEQGYAVDVARDGLDGQHLALEYDYDVIVLDVMLPFADGFSVLRIIRSRKQTPVIMLTARAADHGGLTVGYCSTLVLVPDAQVAVVCLTHATNGGAVNQAGRRGALAEHAGIVERDPEPDPAVAVDVARLAGRFLGPFAQLTISAGEQPNTIVVTSSQREDVDGWKPPPPPPVTMAFVDERHVVTLDAPGPQTWSQLGFGDGRQVVLVLDSESAGDDLEDRVARLE